MSIVSWQENPSSPGVDYRLLNDVRSLPTSLLSDALGRLQGTTALRAFHREPAPFAGTAVTVHTRAGDNLAIYRAFEFLRAGDVLVVDGGGDLTQALIGEIITAQLARMHVQAAIVDGAIRDVEQIARAALPVYARGVTHRGPYKTGPGRINVPVVIDRIVVQPGDLVVGDANGVLALSPADAPTVVRKALARRANEERQLAAIADRGLDLSWVPARTDAMKNE